ncbi:MAG: hypothetical protein HQL39_18335, partial [Alphaproteobacteria bacterium]|nr:hypothetical protein [Alphaproteobacteria bacterium]
MKKTVLAVAGLAGLALSTHAVAQSYPATGMNTSQMPQTQAMPGQSDLDVVSVRQIQQALQRLGHDPGPIDG